MSNPSRRGPRALSDILGELFTVRGYGRLRSRQELENAWNAAVGEPCCRDTRLGEVRRGVLDVTVTHSTLLEELAAFRKPALLAALRSAAESTPIHDIRFRVGSVLREDKPTVASSIGSPVGHGDTGRPGSRVNPRGVAGGRGRKPRKNSDADPIEQ